MNSTDWQPIETAAKRHYARILVLRPSPVGRIVEIAYWDESVQKPFWRSESTAHLSTAKQRDYAPIAWQPLPDTAFETQR